MREVFEPLKDSEWPESATITPQGFAGRLNVYRVMAHHPELLTAWAPLREHVVHQRAMTNQQSEVVILRTGHNLEAPYEWAHHICRARASDMEDARIKTLAGPLEKMTAEDRILAKAVDELIQDSRVQPDTQTAVINLIGAEGLFDVMATVGFYSVLGFIVNSFDVPLDADVAEELAGTPLL